MFARASIAPEALLPSPLNPRTGTPSSAVAPATVEITPICAQATDAVATNRTKVLKRINDHLTQIVTGAAAVYDPTDNSTGRVTARAPDGPGGTRTFT